MRYGLSVGIETQNFFMQQLVIDVGKIEFEGLYD